MISDKIREQEINYKAPSASTETELQIILTRVTWLSLNARDILSEAYLIIQNME